MVYDGSNEVSNMEHTACSVLCPDHLFQKCLPVEGVPSTQHIDDKNIYNGKIIYFILFYPDMTFCHQLLLSGETQYQSKPELLPG